ncbi:MAG: YceI family protein, partial [Burkholderiaceae bacterium]
NEHIQAEDFLDTNKFPKASFKSTKVIFDGDKPTSIEGNLTIKGITKPVTLKVNRYVNKPHPMRKVDVIGADASAVIKRSDFNAGKFAPAVGDEVTITVAIEALKQCWRAAGLASGWWPTLAGSVLVIPSPLATTLIPSSRASPTCW